MIMIMMMSLIIMIMMMIMMINSLCRTFDRREALGLNFNGLNWKLVTNILGLASYVFTWNWYRNFMFSLEILTMNFTKTVISIFYECQLNLLQLQICSVYLKLHHQRAPRICLCLNLSLLPKKCYNQKNFFFS